MSVSEWKKLCVWAWVRVWVREEGRERVREREREGGEKAKQSKAKCVFVFVCAYLLYVWKMKLAAIYILSFFLFRSELSFCQFCVTFGKSFRTFTKPSPRSKATNHPFQHQHPGLNFTNILLDAFKRADPKSVTIQSSCQYLFVV